MAALLEIDETAVSKLENGKRALAASELRTLCDELGLSSNELLFGEQAAPVGALLRAEEGADARRVVEKVEAAFADLRYVQALVES